MEISILTKHPIFPAHPSQPPRLFLSAFDQQFCDKPHFQRMLFYPPHPHSSPPSSHAIASRLSHSLSLALACFYPFAGRFSYVEEGGDEGRIEIACNDAGVELVEASANFSLRDLGELWATNYGGVDELMRSPLVGFHDPLLWLQVTRFSCGGFSLSCSFHHSVADGQAWWQFVRSWAELSRGCAQISSPPSHCRHLLDIVPHHEKQPRMADQTMAATPSQPLSLPWFQPYVFHIPATTLRRLKELARHGGGGEAQGSELVISSFQALCGHFWQCITRARMLPEGTTTRFCVPVNCRGRLKQPEVPEAYFGNMIYGAYASAIAEDLTSRSLRYAASLLHRKIAETDGAWVRRWVEEAERRRVYDWPRLLETELLVVSSPRFPVYDGDFGWGRPWASREVVWSQEHLVVDPSGDGDGSIHVSIALPPHVATRLLADPHFVGPLRLDDQAATTILSHKHSL